jgi:diguanylate cyclase (GGDEF)-like protein/PAS domain S-box-containing protein
VSRGAANFEGLSRPRRRGRLRTRVAVCFLLELCATLLVGTGNTVIWVANGLLLAYLLLAPRWRWRWYLAAGFAGQAAGGILLHQLSWQINVALAALNLLEVLIAAHILHCGQNRLPRFTDRRYLLRFLAIAVFLAPAIAATLFCVIAHYWVGMTFWQGIRDWMLTDPLGIAVATPAFVAIFRTSFRATLSSPVRLVYPLLLVVASPLCLYESPISPTAIIFPLVILILLRLGLGWASMAALYIAGVGSFLSSHPVPGPSPSGFFGSAGAGLQLHLLVASVMFTVYAVSVVMESLRATQRALQKTVFLHNLVTENSRDVIIIADFQGHRSYVSAAASSVGGWSREELLAMHSLELVHPADRPTVAKSVTELRTRGGEAMLECRARKRDGKYVWVEASLRAIRDPRTGNVTGILNIVRDISERKHAEQSREFHQSLLGAIHERSLDGILVVDDRGHAVSYNRRFAEVWQISAPDVPGSMLMPDIEVSDELLLSQVIDKTRDPAAFLERVQGLYADRAAEDHCQVELRDGRTLDRYTTGLHTEDGRYLGRVWFFRDVTERIHAEQKLKAAYDEVEKLAIVDSLTGIANRRRFDEYLETEWRRAMRERHPLSMLLVDVDLFKVYNDTYGHVRGDVCLKEIADSTVEVVTRAGDLVARFGGEEFAIVLPNTDEHGALEIARQLSDAVRNRAISHEGSPYKVVTVSAGCATVVPQPRIPPSRLIEKADRAMYEAKRRGRNRVCVSEDQQLAAATPLAPETAP